MLPMLSAFTPGAQSVAFAIVGRSALEVVLAVGLSQTLVNSPESCELCSEGQLMRLLIRDPEIKDRSDACESVDILLLVCGRGGFPASIGSMLSRRMDCYCRNFSNAQVVLTQMHTTTPHTSRPTDATAAATTAPFPARPPSTAPDASLAAGTSVVLGGGMMWLGGSSGTGM